MTTTTRKPDLWKRYNWASDEPVGKVSAIRISAVLEFDKAYDLDDVSAYDLLIEWANTPEHKRHIDICETQVTEYKQWIDLKTVAITKADGEQYVSDEDDESIYRQVCDNDGLQPSNAGFARWLLERRCDIKVQYKVKEEQAY